MDLIVLTNFVEKRSPNGCDFCSGLAVDPSRHQTNQDLQADETFRRFTGILSMLAVIVQILPRIQ